MTFLVRGRLAVGLVIFLLAGGSASAADAVLGMSATQPSSGPSVKTSQGYMVPYKTKIPASDVEFDMMPIPGGKFKLGSPAGETDRKEDEGPQVEVEVPPYWIGTHEISWAEYKRYMAMHDLFKTITQKKLLPITDANKLDVVTAPSNLYDSTFTFQFGDDPKQPAITMSQFAAKQYTKWLSGLSGNFYRLPTEVEWEYACRAGTTTAYSFGNDATKLGEYAWFLENAEEKTQNIGQKKPNPWGLYDMHGNVAEWVLDQYAKDSYAKWNGKKAAETIAWPTKLYPRIVRGGSWDDEPAQCRSAARKGSHDDNWRADDPNFPQSPWWFTRDYALGVGFRLVRPLEVPPRAEREKFWNADIEQIQRDSDNRIDSEGRGKRSVANGELLKVLETLK